MPGPIAGGYQRATGLVMRSMIILAILAVIVSTSAGAAPEGCADATASIQVQAEDSDITYYVVSTTVNPDAKAKKDKAERVGIEIDARIAIEGVNKDGVRYREELPLHFRLSGVRYGSYSRTVKGDIRGPRVNRHILGITIQRVACVQQESSDQNEDSSVN
jgi:hypothetical protein